METITAGECFLMQTPWLIAALLAKVNGSCTACESVDKLAENSLQLRSGCHGLSWMTVMDNCHEQLSWMTVMDNFHGLVSWMSFMDDFHG